MKGIIFLKPLEYNIEAVGESWRQGDKIKGTLKIKNHSTEKIVIPLLHVRLLSGNYKKIKSKDQKAWEHLQTITLGENLGLSASEELTFPLEFSLAEDCPITDKNGSLYLAFFDRDEISPAGHIELAIAPKQIITQILEVFENFLRFKVKEIKHAKNKIEVKLTPPTSRELSNVDSLILSLSEVNKTLTLDYTFSLRVLEMTGATMVAQKKTKEFKQTLTSKQYLIYGESLNQDHILSSVNEVIKEVTPKLML